MIIGFDYVAAFTEAVPVVPEPCDHPVCRP